MNTIKLLAISTVLALSVGAANAQGAGGSAGGGESGAAPTEKKMQNAEQPGVNTDTTAPGAMQGPRARRLARLRLQKKVKLATRSHDQPQLTPRSLKFLT